MHLYGDQITHSKDLMNALFESFKKPIEEDEMTTKQIAEFNERAHVIGQRLWSLAGFEAMLFIWIETTKNSYRFKRLIQYAWSGIGEWTP